MAAGHADPALAAKLAHRAYLNHESMIAFGAAMAALVGIFAVFNFLRIAPSGFKVSFLRKVRSILVRKIPMLPSAGHLVVICLYLAINLIITFTNFDNKNLPFHSNISSRTGWMAVANMLIVIILSLKNTPLAYLLAVSHERLNIFHRVAGYTTIIFTIVHACSYSSYFASINFLSRLTSMNDIYGMVAGFAFLIIGMSGGIIRKWWYELFYYTHITFWILSIVMVGLHQPELAKRVIFITIAAAAIWLLDRLIRILRLILNSTNNTVTLTPLPHGGTRVLLTKAPLGARSGKHCFLWIPGVRLCETHPFTITATSPLEFVVASYDGFTGALHRHAVQHAGVPLRASVEGAYGALPRVVRKDKIVLVAGGSGASFTVGVALDLLARSGNEDKMIEFIWMVKNQGYIAWFAKHLTTLRNDPRVTIKVYVTRGSTTDLVSAKSATASSHSDSTFTDPEKATLPKAPTTPILDEEKISPVPISLLEQETPISPTCTLSDNIPLIYERPDLAAVVRATIENTPKDQSVLVMSCGPKRLMTVVRNTTAACIRPDGPSVEMHCEQFGW